MRTIDQKLASLKENDVWVFTKQTTDFDEAFKMVKLFSKIPDIENVNIERYFYDNHSRYDIATHNHRALVIPQMFGLLTKTPFFSRGTQYKKEKPTAVFDLLNCCEFGAERYNTIKSEQLLKIRMKPIIDATNDGYDQSILPLIFSFSVLYDLKKKGIDSVSKDQFYTYVMTCKKTEERDEAVELLSQNPQPSVLIDRYKDKSRIETLFELNSKLLLFDGDRVRINDAFGEYFYKSFLIHADINKIDLLLDRPADYAYFLYNYQGFDVNLIDEPSVSAVDIVPKAPKIVVDLDNSMENVDGDSENYDAGYVDLVDEIKESNINLSIADGAADSCPQFSNVIAGKKISKNPMIGMITIINSNYKCVANIDHATFESKKTGMNFMEAHHLIPIRYSEKIWDKFNKNIDCVENLVSLCPNCHRAIHYGSKYVRDELIHLLYMKKKTELYRVGISISESDLLDMYK